MSIYFLISFLVLCQILTGAGSIYPGNLLLADDQNDRIELNMNLDKNDLNYKDRSNNLELLSKLQSHLIPPAKYAEKRAYIPKSLFKRYIELNKYKKEKESSNENNYEDEDYFSSKDNNDNSKLGQEYSDYNDVIFEEPQENDNNPPEEEKTTEVLSTTTPNINITTTTSDSLFGKLKTKVTDLFKSNKTSLEEEFDPFNDILARSSKSKSKRNYENNFIDIRNDDTELNDIYDPNFNIEPIIISKQDNSYEDLDSISAIKDPNIKPTNNPNDLFQNLTQEDINYFKVLITCFKQNKNKFFNDAKSTKQPITTTKSHEKQQSKNDTNSKNLAIKAVAIPLNVTIDLSSNKKDHSTGHMKNNKNDSISLHLDSNESKTDINKFHSVENRHSSGYNIKNRNFTNLLLFLAHQHHFVSDIGKLPYKPLDLKNITRQIEKYRQFLDLASKGFDYDNETDCTPIQIKEISMDFDLPEHKKIYGFKSRINQPLFSRNLYKKSDVEKTVADYLSDSKVKSGSLIKSPYADNFLDDNNFIGDYTDIDWVRKSSKNFNQPKKRQINVDIDKILSDVSSSLNDINKNNRGLVSDDYFTDLREKEKKANQEGNKMMRTSVQENDENVGLFGNKKKRKHRKKGKKRPHIVSNIKEKERIFIPDDDDIVKKITLETPSEHLSHDYEQKLNTQNFAPKFIPTFDELNDIHFRISPNEEEAIDKFMQSLNSPPEIFTFDVDQYIKPEDNSRRSPINLAPEPIKTFYEFLDPEVINSKNTAINAEETDIKKSDRFDNHESNDEYIDKRDTLREYIKGISNHVLKIPPFIEHEGFSSYEQELPSFNQGEVESNVNNYATNFDDNNYKKDEKIDKKQETDDFIDKFYLLNDGREPYFTQQEKIEKLDIPSDNKDKLNQKFNEFKPLKLWKKETKD